MYLLATFDKIPSYCGDAKFEPTGPAPGPKPGPAGPNVNLLGPCWGHLSDLILKGFTAGLQRWCSAGLRAEPVQSCAVAVVDQDFREISHLLCRA